MAYDLEHNYQGGYQWVVEDQDPKDYVDMTDQEIIDWVDDIASDAISHHEAIVEFEAGKLDYPIRSRGKLIRDVYDYLDIESKIIEEGVTNDKPYLIRYIKEWIESAEDGGDESNEDNDE